MKTYGFSTSASANNNNSTTTTTTVKQITTSGDLDQNGVGLEGQEVSTVKDGLADKDGFIDELGSVPTMGDNLVHVSVYFNTLNERKVETVEVYDVRL